MIKLTTKEQEEIGQEIKEVKKEIKFLKLEVPKEHPIYQELLELWRRTLEAEKYFQGLKST